MSVLNSWNGGIISDGKIIKINIDGKQYNLEVKDDRAYKDEGGTGYKHVTLADSVGLYFTVTLVNSTVNVKFLSWPTVMTSPIASLPVAGEYVKMTSIGGREVECKNMKRIRLKRSPPVL